MVWNKKYLALISYKTPLIINAFVELNSDAMQMGYVGPYIFVNIF